MRYFLVLVLLIGISSSTPKSCQYNQSQYKAQYTLNGTQKIWTVSLGSGGVATAILCQEGNTTGWDFLQITTEGSYSDEDQAYAAGFLEGGISIYGIYYSWKTFKEYKTFYPEVRTFVQQQDQWIKDTANAKREGSPYWNTVYLLMKQFDGIYDGYSKYGTKEMQTDYIDFLLYNMNTELGDIHQHFSAKKGISILPQGRIPLNYETHCSVLVKVTDDKSNLFNSHATWSDYWTLIRTFKVYKYNYTFTRKSGNSHTITMSGYPGILQSIDDYYMTSANLVITETTNSIFNASLFLSYISPQSVSEWIRVMVANMLAVDGETWVGNFSQFNSGTYNNQWQIINHNLFTPGQPLKAGLLTIAEQIPGFIVSADKTDVLESQGYWPSYNVPYFPFIYNISGFPAMYKQYGDQFSYDHCPRANIFRRDQKFVRDMPSFQKIMRYNKFQTDPLSLKNACNSISARCDLNTPWSSGSDYAATGAIDCKVADHVMVLKGISLAVNGPTWDSQPPFAWTDEFKMPHYGQAKLFANSWVEMSPK